MNWREIERQRFLIIFLCNILGAWVLRPKTSKVTFYQWYICRGCPTDYLSLVLGLECLADRGILVIATPFASSFDHFLIADEVQFKFERCLSCLQETVEDIPTFCIGHSLGSVVHLLIGSRYAAQRNGNILMTLNKKGLRFYVRISGDQRIYAGLLAYLSQAARESASILDQACGF